VVVSAIERLPGVGPKIIRCGLAFFGEAEIPARRTRRVVLLEGRGLFSARFLDPPQPLQVGEVDDERVEAAPLGFVGHAGQIYLGQLLYVIGVDGALLPSGSLLFRPRGLVERCSSHQGRLVLVEDIGLRSACVGVYLRRAMWPMAQEEFPGKQAAAEGAEKATAARLERQSSHFSSRSIVFGTIVYALRRLPFDISPLC
jgi:hypothetical protein